MVPLGYLGDYILVSEYMAAYLDGKILRQIAGVLFDPLSSDAVPLLSVELSRDETNTIFSGQPYSQRPLIEKYAAALSGLERGPQLISQLEKLGEQATITLVYNPKIVARLDAARTNEDIDQVWLDFVAAHERLFGTAGEE